MKIKLLLSIALVLAGLNTFAQWTALPSGTSNDLNSVYFNSFNSGYAVGNNGAILKTNNEGLYWYVLSSGTTETLYSVMFPDLSNGYIGGGSGQGAVLLATNNAGLNWANYSDYIDYIHTIFSLTYFYVNEGYAACSNGHIIDVADGYKSWKVEHTGIGNDLYSIFFTNSVTAYAVGWNGIIIHTTDQGNTWHTQSEGSTLALNSVFFPNVLTGYAVGHWGTILKTTNSGSTWTPLSSGTTNWLRSVYFTDQFTGYVVGDLGLILKTSDGGITWITQASGTSERLNSVVFTDANTGYIVGSQGTILKTTNGGGIYPPTITTTVPSSITGTSAILGGNITNDGGAPVTARGVCIAYWEYPDLTDFNTNEGTGSGSFTSAITDLVLATTYHVRAYATNSAGTSYGNDMAFTTVCPTSYSLPFYEGFGTGNQPACWTQFDHQGNGQVWQFGSVAGYDPDPALDYYYAFLNSDGYGSGHSQNADLISPVFDLSDYSVVTLGFNHFFRSWANSSGTISYCIGNTNNWISIQTFTETTANPAIFSQSIPAVAGQSQVRFKWNYTRSWAWYWAIDDIQVTGVSKPTLSTTVPGSVTNAAAISGGNISSDGGAPVTARGVCWGTSASPNIAGNHTIDGTGPGIFVSSITGLSPGTIYHVRAYATNSTGTSYGNDISFTSSCVFFELPFNEGFSTTVIPNCWYQIDTWGDGGVWEFGVLTGYYIPALTGIYAYLNSAGFPSGSTQDADLVSPRLDLSGYSDVTLQFNHYFLSWSSSSGTLSYSINDGSTWTTIQTFTETTANPTIFSQSIPGLAGQSQVRFKWNFSGSDAWFWAIDDIRVTDMQTNKDLANITIGSGTTSCYNASQTITVAGNGTTFLEQSGGDVTLIAGRNILFMPGTLVESGGHLWGYITENGAYCVNPSVPVNETPDMKETETVSETQTTLFRVYPNPTTGKFTLELNGDLKDNQATVRIYGMMGEEVLQENLDGKTKTEFSLSNRSNGIYIIRVTMGDKMEGIKIIKQ